MNALVAVDLQNDFMPGGALPVHHGDEVLPIINQIQHRFDLVVATQDWHLPEHCSFAANHFQKKPGDRIQINGIEQILWPVHCVQETWGARLHKDFDRSKVVRIFFKGIDPFIDSYSTFFDNAHLRHTGLENFLHQHGVSQVFLAGLALDYCVLYSALDALRLGFETFVIVDACRGIDLQPGDVERALKTMKNSGAKIVLSTEIRG